MISIGIWLTSSYKDDVREFHYKDTMVSQLSYPCNGNPYTQKDCLYFETGYWNLKHDLWSHLIIMSSKGSWKCISRLTTWSSHNCMICPVNTSQNCSLVNEGPTRIGRQISRKKMSTSLEMDIHFTTEYLCYFIRHIWNNEKWPVMSLS